MDLLSWSTAVFFVITLALYWSLRGRLPRQVLIVAATTLWFCFGVWWHAIAAAVMGTTSWFTGRWIASRHEDERELPVIIGVTLPILYFLFFRHFAHWVGFEAHEFDELPFWAPNPILAPIGLSFIMFESIAFQLDLYWQKIERPGSWWSHMVFTMYFPTRVIGPMRKYQEFSDQVGALASPSPELIREGLSRIGIGLLRKVVIANPIGTFAFFQLKPDMIEDGNFVPIVLGVYAFWVYLYFDFTGYTDIVVGLSKLLGIDVPENFNRPYLARNVSQYWQRWHMSLSSWVREYVYTPLAIAWRGRMWGPPVSALASMIVLGLWHGIEMRFIAFGLWHGLWLGGYMLYSDTIKKTALGKRITKTRTWSLVGWFLTFNVIVWSHIFYAVPTYADAIEVYRVVFGF